MDHSISRFTGLNADLIVEILSRLDGPSVAYASCACSDLRDAAEDRELWRQACKSIWPSTSLPETESMIQDFKRFYAESYPLVCYRMKPDWNKVIAGVPQTLAPEMETCEFQDFISLVDVYYGKICILSRVSVPESDALKGSREDKPRRSTTGSAFDLSNTWLKNYPFRWQVLESPQTYIQTFADTQAEQGTQQSDVRINLEQDLRLSWVLLDKKTGKSVNLSSWKPIFLQRGWSIDGGEYTVHFGSIIRPTDASLFPEEIVKCTIAVSCKLNDINQVPELGEINLHIEDTTGKHLNGEESLMILNQSLFCPRSTNKTKIEQGIAYYRRKKRDLMRKKELKERVAIGVFASVQVTVFAALVYILVTSFS